MVFRRVFSPQSRQNNVTNIKKKSKLSFGWKSYKLHTFDIMNIAHNQTFTPGQFGFAKVYCKLKFISGFTNFFRLEAP